MRKIRCNLHVESFGQDAVAELRANEEFNDAGALEAGLALSTGEYVFKYSYPLANEAQFKHTLDGKSNVMDVLKLAAADYTKIYEEENASSAIPEGYIPGMYNRVSTNGKHGIWGHVLGDLFFEGVEIDEEKRTVEFIMGS